MTTTRFASGDATWTVKYDDEERSVEISHSQGSIRLSEMDAVIVVNTIFAAMGAELDTNSLEDTMLAVRDRYWEVSA